MERCARVLIIIFLAFLCTISGFGPARAETKSLVRIDISDADGTANLPRALDVAGGRMGQWIDVVATAEELVEIRAAGLPTRIIHQDLEAYANSVKGYYHNFPELISNLEAFAFIFPAITRLDTLATTSEGRPIMAMKISDNVNLDEPDESELLFLGLHHAREWPSMEIAYFIIERLLFDYGVDPEITAIVDQREIWVLPCVNPDGYVYCHDQGHDWRKNRRYFPQFNSYGVDLNRNYDGSCNGVSQGAWGTTTTYGTSHNPWGSTYCGPYPFSEIETQTVRDLYLAHDFVLSVSYHTHMEAVIWPWGYAAGAATPDDDLLVAVGTEMASRIRKQSSMEPYDAAQSTSLGYTTTGDTDDWAYGYYHYIQGSNCLPYTVEACNEFHPQEATLDQVVRENFDGVLYLCQIADSVAGLLTSRVLPPAIDSLDRAPSGDYIVSWRPQSPEAGTDFYRLDELSGLSVAADDAESDGDLWELEGFSISGTRSHGAGHSYHSSSQTINAYDAMTAAHPHIVAPGDSLTFWCWYDIDEIYDMAYAEISTDGRSFSLLDTTATFTASSEGWVRKAYSLQGYVGQSVYFRFRYTTDGENEREGFYLDDISPVASYVHDTILSVSIADTFYAIAGRPQGNYTYRVKGHNAARGWGDWSGCREVNVGPALPRRISDLTAVLSGGFFLSWSPVTFDTEGQLISIDHYVIHRDTSFAFAASPANSLDVTAGPLYEDLSGQTGNPSVDHYYLVRAVDGQGNKSQGSNRVGEFDRYLTRVK